MKLYGFEAIYQAVLDVLSYPWAMVSGILSNITLEFRYINRVVSAGKMVSLVMIWNQLKWVLLLLVIAGAVYWVVSATILGVFNTERQKQRGLLFEFSVVILSLFAYYSLIAIGLYVLFNVIIPIALEL